MFHMLALSWDAVKHKKGAVQSPRAVSLSLTQLLVHTPSAQLVPGVEACWETGLSISPGPLHL